jgi:uncharacterized membrane protein
VGSTDLPGTDTAPTLRAASRAPRQRFDVLSGSYAHGSSRQLRSLADVLAGKIRHGVAVNSRCARAAALLTTGLLAGAFLYGWAIVIPTFAAVPLDIHLVFRTELMKSNAPLMQTLMGSALATSVWYALAIRDKARWAAAGAAVLALISLVVTRFGNVPINLEIKEWARGPLDPGYQDRLRAWEALNDARVAAAVGALVLLVVAVDLSRSGAAIQAPHSRARSARE